MSCGDAVGLPAARAAGALLLRLRGWGLGALGPLSAAAAGPLAAFRASKQLADAARLGGLLYIQSWRTGALDAFFVATSFLGNADFYLLVLPTMLWQGAPRIGRQTTYMVTSSLVLGNTMKDLVALPRPPSPPVWRPASGAALDSSAFADFGWPSTHAMNAVSNPLLIACALAPFWRRSPRRRWAVAALSVTWAATISVGRLYLGAHSRSDVFAGHLLGLAVGCGWVLAAPWFDATVTGEGHQGGLLVGGAMALSAGLFTLYPRRAIAGASAPQSAELTGLFLGCMVGSRQDARRRRRRGVVADAAADGAAGHWARRCHPGWVAAAREALGFALALSCRALASALSTRLVGGLRLRGPTAEGVGVLLRKLLTYFTIAWSMTGGAPPLFRALRIEATEHL